MPSDSDKFSEEWREDPETLDFLARLHRRRHRLLEQLLQECRSGDSLSKIKKLVGAHDEVRSIETMTTGETSESTGREPKA